MLSFAFSFVLFLAGVVAALLVSRHYFHRTTTKELTPFLLSHNNVFQHIAPEIKKELQIKFRNVNVDQLQNVSFLIANTGERALSGFIKPLILQIPSEGTLIDASLTYVRPEGREVNVVAHDTARMVEFNFPVLNRDEFFITSLLVKGGPKIAGYKFSVTADDLPPMLPIKRIRSDQISTKEVSESFFEKVEVAPALIGLAALFLSALNFLLAHNATPSWAGVVNVFQSDPTQLLSLQVAAKLAAYAVSTLLALLGIALVGVSLDAFEMTKKRRFIIPEDIRVHWPYSQASDYLEDVRAEVHRHALAEAEAETQERMRRLQRTLEKPETNK